MKNFEELEQMFCLPSKVLKQFVLSILVASLEAYSCEINGRGFTVSKLRFIGAECPWLVIGLAAFPMVSRPQVLHFEYRSLKNWI
jgi:hypothetical protein